MVYARIAELAADEGLTVLGWRDVPVKEAACGEGAREALPHLAQLFVAGEAGEAGLMLDRMAFCLRKRVTLEHEVDNAYFASCCCPRAPHRSYKGMLSAPQVEAVLPPTCPTTAYASNLALVHSLASLHQHVPVLEAEVTPTGTSRTTARSTPSRGKRTGTGCGPARPCWTRR